MQGFKIGSAFGIPIRLNWTFLLILPLFALLIGWDIAQLTEVVNQVLGAELSAEALDGQYRPWLLGLAAGIGLFIGVLLHEFGHSLVALRYGYEIESITLWLLGGLANFEEFPENWKHEFWISVAGPIVSVGVGLACYAGFLLVPDGGNSLLFLFGYLAMLNVVLAVFNMLPAFPMDGGRVLRALLSRNQPHAKATQQAATIGKGFAFLLGLLGLFSNPILLLLAFFIYIAASGEAQQTALSAAFEDVTVSDVMTPTEDLETVTETTTVSELMGRMLQERHTGYPVVRNGNLVGIVTLGDARSVREVERDAYRVEEVMSDDVVTIAPDANAIEALEQMREQNIGRLPVVDDGELVGLISRTDLMTAFDIMQAGGSAASLGGRPLNTGDDPLERFQ